MEHDPDFSFYECTALDARCSITNITRRVHCHWRPDEAVAMEVPPLLWASSELLGAHAGSASRTACCSSPVERATGLTSLKDADGAGKGHASIRRNAFVIRLRALRLFPALTFRPSPPPSHPRSPTPFPPHCHCLFFSRALLMCLSGPPAPPCLSRAGVGRAASPRSFELK